MRHQLRQPADLKSTQSEALGVRIQGWKSESAEPYTTWQEAQDGTLFTALQRAPGMLWTDPTILEPPVVALAATTFICHHLDTYTDIGVKQPRRRSQGQLAAVAECMTPNAPHRVRYGDAFLRGTALEGTILKLLH